MIELFTEVVAGFTLLGSILAAYWAQHAKREATAANDAVNHRHESGTPRLYDLAVRNDERTKELIEWKRGYDGGPLDSGDKVEDFVRKFEELRDSCGGCPTRNAENEATPNDRAND